MTRWERLARAGTATGVLALGLLLVAPPASAVDDSQGTPGFCPDDEGVTVVVDFQQLGAETVVRCAPGSEPRLALDVLEGAGFQVDGVARWGDGFVCRIEDRPAAGEQLPIEGDDHYQEACLDTPPASGYWAYWYADDGGDWQYSPYGVESREVLPGGFEGWSFSLNSPDGQGSPPRVAPDRPQTDSAGQQGDSAGVDEQVDEHAAVPGAGKRGAAPPPLPRGQRAGDGPGLSTRLAAPAEAPRWNGGAALPDVDAERRAASPVPTVLGLGAAVGLAGVAIAVSVRRRRSRLGS